MDASQRKDSDPAHRGNAGGLPLPLLVGGGLVAAAVAVFLLPRADSGKKAEPKPAASTAAGEAAVADALPSEEVVKELRIRPADKQPVAEGARAEPDRRPDAVASDTPRPLKADDVAVFMRAKLDHSKDVIEGLAMEDFDAIYRGAHDLALASQASAWEVLLTEEYARQSAEFRRSCESLRKAARDENLDAASLAWMDVTMKCVQCHKYVRQADEAGR
jgi:hypothetical protein